MRNLFLLLISTAITSLGIARLKSVGNSNPKISGNFTNIVSIDARETKNNLFLKSFLVAGFEISDYEHAIPSKEITISKKTIDFYTFDGCQKQITLYDFYYKINKILYTKGVV
jgi:hypothetical protein